MIPVRTWRLLRRCTLATSLAAVAVVAAAHGSSVGDIHVEHAFATPSLAGSSNGAAYFASLENAGDKADRLVRASTPVAASVELHSMAMDAQGVMRMREVDGIALAPKAAIKMRPGQGFHLMMIGLREPLKEGATFPMTLTFERAGKLEVKVVVQTPRADAASAGMHMH